MISYTWKIRILKKICFCPYIESQYIDIYIVRLNWKKLDYFSNNQYFIIELLFFIQISLNFSNHVFEPLKHKLCLMY